MEITTTASVDVPTLPRRLYRALTAGKEELYKVLEDPSMEVLSTALKNPLTDGYHLLALLKRRDLSEELLKSVYRLEQVGDSHSLKLALARHPNTSASLLAAIIPHLYLFDLLNVCYLPGVTPDQKLAAERAIIQRIPATPLGNKLTLARRATTAIAEALIREGDSRLLEACLNNPSVKEAAIFGLLNSAQATPESISLVARHHRWQHRPNLRLAILKNPKTPPVWFTLFLPQLPLNDLKGLLLSFRLSLLQTQCVQDELKRRGQACSPLRKVSRV